MRKEEKENERSRQGKVIAFSISGGLAGIGAISEIVIPYNVLGIFAIIVTAYIALFTLISMDNSKKTRRIISSGEVQITENMESCERENYDAVTTLFSAAGFTNIQTIALKDLNFFRAGKNGQVESVSINGDDGFEKGEVFKKTDRVIITYHSTK